MRLGIVILHYQALKDTINCVESILKNIKNVLIVIVDNKSPNGSGEELSRIYRDSSNIECIKSDVNLGFSKGNNLGYQYLKYKKKCDYICCINNDTLVGSDFSAIIQEEYIGTGYSVLAPMVELKDGSIQSFNYSLSEVEEYFLELKNYQENLTLEGYLNSKNFSTKLLVKYPLIGRFVRKIKQKIKCKYKERMENVVLHGCFLIFSPTYVNMFDTAFDDRTFMFREEELLFLRIKEHNLKSLYCPAITVSHLEDAATNLLYKTDNEKYLFVRENQVLSLGILIKELERFKS